MVAININMPKRCKECRYFVDKDERFNNFEYCLLNEDAGGTDKKTGRMFGCPFVEYEETSTRAAVNKVWHACTVIHYMSDEELKECFNAKSPIEVLLKYKDDPLQGSIIVSRYLRDTNNKNLKDI